MGTVWAVVPAAGRGTRFGGETPKQYLVAGDRVCLPIPWRPCCRTRSWPG